MNATAPTAPNTDTLAAIEALTAEVRSLRSEVAQMRRSQAAVAELSGDVALIGKDVMAAAIDTFGELEKKGYFAFGRELLGIADRVVSNYGADDVRELGDNVVTILDTVRSLTQPEVLAYAQEAGDAIERGRTKGPTGAWELIKASRDRDIQHGMAFMLGVVRQIGRASRNSKRNGRMAVSHPAYGKVAGRLAASRPRRERRPRAAARSAAPPASTAAVAKAAVAKTFVAEPLPAPFSDVALDANGHIADADAWSRELAQLLATRAGVGQLGEAHWQIIDFARADFTAKGKSPNVRRVAKGSGVGTKGVYRSFPHKPGVTVAFIAGLPKPVGCI